MGWLGLALAAPPGAAAWVDALALASGQDKVAADEGMIQAAMTAACAAGAPLACAGPVTLAQLEADCAAGQEGSCVAVAWALTQRDGQPSAEAPDPARGAALLERACAAGVLRACVDHAALEQAGIGVPAAPTAAVAVLRSACDRGEPRACVRLGKAHQSGLGTPIDLGQARVRYQQACDEGLPAGCNALGLAAHLGVGGDKDPIGALGLVRQACAAHFTPACDNLDVVYRAGLDGAPDDAREPLLRVGCDEGYAAACGHLGDLIAQRDPAAALTAWTTACDADFARGCRGVAMHRLAAGDLQGGLPLLMGACDVGEPLACRELGRRAAQGDGLPKDLEAAFAARELACRGGDGPSCAAAAVQLKKGRGALRDPVGAEALVARACALGHAESCK